MVSIASRAAKWVLICSSVKVASNCATRSPELTTFLPKPANQLKRAGIHQRNREHQVVGRVLHGDVAMSRQHRLDLVEKLLPAGILELGPGRVSRCPASILCTSLVGSPCAGMR